MANGRLAAITSGIKSIASACSPRLKHYRVSFMKKVPAETAGMFKHEWTEVEVDAYNRDEAAMMVDPSFKPGYNCWVNTIIGGKK